MGTGTGHSDAGGVPVGYPPYAFVQATDDGEAALIAAVTEIIGDAKRVADLFCGLGTFTFAVGENRKVYAAEGELKALLALKNAAGFSGRTVFTEHRDLFRRPLSPQELNRFDAVILDPPRAGSRDQVQQLAASQVPRIAFVSCNPGSFARDAKQLVDGGYRLQRIWPVGQFRWSTHVELSWRIYPPIAALSRETRHDGVEHQCDQREGGKREQRKASHDCC